MQSESNLIDVITPEENALAQKLRSYCHAWGSEKESELKNSASILLELGQLYLEKAKESSGISQKLNFIKSAALIVGARVRFEKHVQDDSMYMKADDAFKDLIKELLNACGKNQSVDIAGLSKDIADHFMKARFNERNLLRNGLVPINYDECPETVLSKQKNKIKNMKNLSKSNSELYRLLMTTISTTCLTFKPPKCQMALVGSGSLAREEITLYSDFEHVILLEDGVDDSLSGDIREYYRWYSVLFQVTIIGMGETLIPSVGIKSLNDFWAHDKTKNWFYDHFTPSGVSFDGRLPHASKTGIGWQEPYVLELIQPVTKMAALVTKEEDRKNGFYLRDILIKTCFLHGSEEIYKKFRTLVDKHVSVDKNGHHIRAQVEFIATNSSSFIGIPKEYSLFGEKLKDSTYRPITVMVSSLARIFRFSGTNFDFFDWTREKYPSLNLHEVEYALTVSVEVREKLYTVSGHQIHKVAPQEICNSVGRTCVAQCIRTIRLLGQIFHEAYQQRNETLLQDFVANLSVATSPSLEPAKNLVDAIVLSSLGFTERNETLYKKEDVKRIFSEVGRSCLGTKLTAALYYFWGNECPERRTELYLLATKTIDGVVDDEHTVFIKSDILCWQNQHQSCYDVITKWMEEQVGISNTESGNTFCYLQYLRVESLFKIETPEDFLLRAKVELSKYPDKTNQIILRTRIAEALQSLGRENEASLYLREAVDACRSVVNIWPSEKILKLVHEVFFRQLLDSARPDNAQETLKFITYLRGHKDGLDPVAKDASMSKYADAVAAVKYFEGQENFDVQKAGGFAVYLGDLLEKAGIEGFSAIRSHFIGVRDEVLYQPLFYSSISIVLLDYIVDLTQMHSATVIQTPLLKITADCLRFFEAFRHHLSHPFFIKSVQNISTILILKDLEFFKATKSVTTAHSYPEDHGLLASLFNQAIRDISEWKLENGTKILWKILHSKETSHVKKKSITFMVHIIVAKLFQALKQFFAGYHSSVAKRLSFIGDGNLQVYYNNAVKELVQGNIETSSSCFWKVIHRAGERSNIQKRSIETLLFAVVTKWERDGYLTGIDGKYVSFSTNWSGLQANAFQLVQNFGLKSLSTLGQFGT